VKHDKAPAPTRGVSGKQLSAGAVDDSEDVDDECVDGAAAVDLVPRTDIRLSLTII